MTKNNNILNMVPLHTHHITAVAALGCYSPYVPAVMPYDNWVFPVDIMCSMHEVLEKLAGDEEDYPYIAVLGFRTLFGIN